MLEGQKHVDLAGDPGVKSKLEFVAFCTLPQSYNNPSLPFLCVVDFAFQNGDCMKCAYHLFLLFRSVGYILLCISINRLSPVKNTASIGVIKGQLYQ